MLLSVDVKVTAVAGSGWYSGPKVQFGGVP